MTPRYWLTWSGLGILWLVNLMPLPVLFYAGGLLGDLLLRLVPSRRKIALQNLQLCFPELSSDETDRMLRRNFQNTARMFLFSGFVWWGSRQTLRKAIRVQNAHLIDQSLSEGHGVVLLAPHFVAMEVAGIFLSTRYPGVSIYQRSKNQALDRVMLKARSRFGGQMIERKSDMRSLIRAMRKGRPCYYLPDQDPGPRRAVFAPFFGIPTATWPVLGRIATLTDAKVLPCTTHLLPGGAGFEIIVDPPILDFPTGETVADCEIMNQAIENCVRRMPDQYFWVHKRFKTRPRGSPDLYP